MEFTNLLIKCNANCANISFIDKFRDGNISTTQAIYGICVGEHIGDFAYYRKASGVMTKGLA
jgi:hypothetical protein